MIYIEPKTITVFYNQGKGEMNVRVDEFIQHQTISKIKKLINLIRTSEKPDTEQIIVDWCKKWLSLYESEQKTHANLHVHYMDKMHEFERDAEISRTLRDSYKKKSQGYKNYAEQMKGHQEKAREARTSANSHKRNFQENERIKEKIDKVLEFISQR